MTLHDVWFGIFVALIAGYIVLDGFDLGVGILHPFLGRDDATRRLALNSVAPVWDGNEVWLVLGAGVLFGAFPIAYAAILSGFYPGIVLILLTLILRTVAIEFRSRRGGHGWRQLWDIVFFGSSAAVAALLGLAVGDIILGVPINSSGDVSMKSVADLLHPLALWLGLATVAMVAMHGALYLNLRTQGALQRRARASIPALQLTFLTTAVVAVVWMLVTGSIEAKAYLAHLWLLGIPGAALAALALSALTFALGMDFAAFFWSGVTLALGVVSLAAGLYPTLLPSTTSPSYSMTVSNAASAPETLAIMLIVVVIGIPFLLLYAVGVRYMFRGKVTLSDEASY